MKKILLIVGPSGCGKDALLRAARKYFLTDARFQFLKRYITRAPGDSEENYFVEDVGFTLLRKNKFFVSSWDAHDLKYPAYRRSGGGGREVLAQGNAHRS